MLYSAMEDAKLDILIGKGPTARSIRLDLPSLHLGRSHDPDRSGGRARCATASASWVASTSTTRPTCAPSCERSARILRRAESTRKGRPASPSAPGERRGSPTGCCDGCATSPRSEATASSTAPPPSEGLELFGVDELGLDKVDRAILDHAVHRFGGQPVGLTTLAQCVGEEPDTIEDAYEPFLLQQRPDPAHGPGAGGHRAGLGAPGPDPAPLGRRRPLFGVSRSSSKQVLEVAGRPDPRRRLEARRRPAAAQGQEDPEGGGPARACRRCRWCRRGPRPPTWRWPGPGRCPGRPSRWTRPAGRSARRAGRVRPRGCPGPSSSTCDPGVGVGGVHASRGLGRPAVRT